MTEKPFEHKPIHPSVPLHVENELRMGLHKRGLIGVREHERESLQHVVTSVGNAVERNKLHLTPSKAREFLAVLDRYAGEHKAAGKGELKQHHIDTVASVWATMQRSARRGH